MQRLKGGSFTLYQPVIEAAIEKLPEHPSGGTRQTLYMILEVGGSSDMIRLL